jgi:hypothetical protein
MKGGKFFKKIISGCQQILIGKRFLLLIFNALFQVKMDKEIFAKKNGIKLLRIDQFTHFCPVRCGVSCGGKL